MDSISVKNRDIPLLQSVFAIMQEICAIESRREWQYERATNITAHLSFTSGAGGGIRHGFDDVLATIGALDEDHKDLLKRYSRELRKAERILNSIENLNMRAFVRMMYMENMAQNDVQEKLNMTRYGFQSARKAVEDAERMADVKWHDKFYVKDE